MTIPRAKIRNALRQLWRFSPERKAALKWAAVRGYGSAWHRCALCGAMTGEAEVDHLEAVGPTPGSRVDLAMECPATWDGLISRLFVPADKLQVLCKKCHLRKTNSAAKNGVPEKGER
jgi:5-methylcytosine-specific restriction endonuclease McrA